MKAPLSLRKPSNWQDFETLCLKLWGEIWACPEIKKNGRTGQKQHGVDVYGTPSWDTAHYYGIQCKGKDENLNSQFSKKEIEAEIEKAKQFKPRLKKFYLATTANKDAAIEEFVREKNQQNILNGLFEVHIYAWEDIVEKIDENPNTQNWYVKSQNYKTVYDVNVTFDDGSTAANLLAKFKKEYVRYAMKILPDGLSLIGDPHLTSVLQMTQQVAQIQMVSRDLLSREITNLSYVPFALKITNTGSGTIEDYKLQLTFKGDISDISRSNTERTGIAAIRPYVARYRDISINTDNSKGDVVPEDKTLVSDDVYLSDTFYLKPLAKQTTVTIEWKLISRDFKKSGELVLNIAVDIEPKHRTILISDPLKVGTIEGDVEDYFDEKPA